ncbi:WbqC family protein [Paraflavitalea pollutisoli]|uniref:WbqC family protein n=1 Tax=Paraflavitalea pollutisoli TaxID=3034143 RepID=UPI0023ED2CCA|nr:WbqC family protein [Paraflavitalea sp. H1-2-19X]
MSFRNRLVLAGAGGPVSLSIPLEEGRGQRKMTKDVRIANRYSWQSQHWKTIVSCYNRSPWFEFYRDELESLYSRQVNFLVDWNMACWEWTIRQLGWSTSISLTTQPVEKIEVTEWLDLRNEVLPKNIHQRFRSPVLYRQVFEDRTGFLPHCSILDLLCCEGKNARALLKAN